NLNLYTTIEGSATGLINYVEVLRSINEHFSKFVHNYFKWNVYNPFHDLVEVSNPASGNRYLKKGSEMTPDDYGTLDLWRNQITQVSNKNFRNNNKIPAYQAGLHTRNYDRGNEGLKYDEDQSSMENHIHGYDIDTQSTVIADKINDAWMINENQKIKNFTKNADCIDFSYYDLIISTSVEDISSHWYNNIKPDTLVCLQAIDLSSEISQKYPDWKIQNHISDMETFKEKYAMKDIFFEGVRTYDYTHLKYNRFMLIGKK
ncbi:MAG: hypothetical protein EB127_22215, partial [Alphaproteobacteria bacterium]|nr:hypothetical protein [Alphaproteobacteria bacterium]